MVDAAARVPAAAGGKNGGRAAARGRTDRIVVGPVTANTLAQYEQFGASGLAAPAQSPLWIRAWVEATRRECFAITIFQDDHPVFALPLEVTARAGCRIARFMGERHANGNFALADPNWLATLPAEAMTEMVDAVSRARPDVDVLALERLAPDLGGLANPLLAFAHTKSPDIALAVNLSGGFQQLMARPNGKRKRKKHRSDLRKFEAMGGVRRVEADTPAEVDRLLDAFFSMKASRFRKAGIPDVFAVEGVQAFFRQLFKSALPLRPRPFVLRGLESAGVIRAVTGSSLCGDRLICEFGAVVPDDGSSISPGEYLFFEEIQEAADRGLAIYDFSVGDEPYKRSWCDIESTQFDVVLPLTTKGRLYAASSTGVASLKGWVKSNPVVWRLVKKFRRSVAGEAAPAQDD